MEVHLLCQLLVVPKFSAVIPGARDVEDVSMPTDHKLIAKDSGTGDSRLERIICRLRVIAHHIQ